MAKRFITVLLLLGIVCGLFAACTPEQETITFNEAWEIVRQDLGDAAANAEPPHFHEGTYNNQKCFNIYVTVDGESLVYIISATGQILHKGHGSHSH